MKTRLLIPLFLILGMTMSCQKNTELTEEQKKSIISEVEAQWKISGEGIEQLNAVKAFSVFSKKEGTTFLREGYLYPNIKAAQNQYAEWFSNPNALKQKLSVDTVIYNILNKDLVLVITIASIYKVDTTNLKQEPWIIGYTLLWQKEDEGWKLIHMHNSWK
jgi:hypothetical protein